MKFTYAIVELLACISIFWMMIIFFECFLERKERLTSYKLLVLFAVYVAVSYLPMDFISNTIMSVGCLLLQFLIIFLCFDGKVLFKAILLLGFTAYDLAIAIISASAFQVLFGISQEQLLMPGTPYRFIYLIGSNLFEFLLILLLYGRAHRDFRLGLREMIITLLFFANEVFSLFLSFLVLMSTEAEWVKVVCSFLTFAFLLCTFVVLALLSQINQQAKQLYHNQLLSLQIAEQEKQLLRYHEDYQQIQTIRHDIKRYLLNYKTLLEEGNYETVKQDIDHMLHDRLAAQSIIYTQNRLLNSIIQYTADLCREEQIALTTNITIAETYLDMEVMVLISNLLDNAREASLKEANNLREIKISIGPVGNQMSIVVQNRITASVLDQNQSLASTKTDPGKHGFGIPSVSQVVHNRKGLMNITEEDNYFIVHVLLPMTY